LPVTTKQLPFSRFSLKGWRLKGRIEIIRPEPRETPPMRRSVYRQHKSITLRCTLAAMAATALLAGCSGGSARSDYYTLRGFYVQPSSPSASTLAIAPTE